jgi:hypothetical protein
VSDDDGPIAKMYREILRGVPKERADSVVDQETAAEWDRAVARVDDAHAQGFIVDFGATLTEELRAS